MTDLPLLTWVLVLAALVLGILAGHFGWGKRWPGILEQTASRLSDRTRLPGDRAARSGARHVPEADGRQRRHHRDAFRPGFAVSAARRSRARHPHSSESPGARGTWLPSIANRRCSRWRRTICAPACSIARRACFSRSAKCRACAPARSMRCAGLRAAARLAAGARRLSATGAHQGGAAAHGRRALPVRTGQRSRSSAATPQSARRLLREARAEATPFPARRAAARADRGARSSIPSWPCA